MPEMPLDQVIRQLDGARFSVGLGLDKGQFQNLVLGCWPTIMLALRREADRRKHISVVQSVKTT